MHKKQLGVKINELRLKLGFTLNDFAKELNKALRFKKANRSLIYFWEHGLFYPSEKYARAISELAKHHKFPLNYADIMARKKIVL